MEIINYDELPLRFSRIHRQVVV